MHVRFTRIGSNIAARIAAAVAAFLLLCLILSSPSQAGLLTEVSKEHWSYKAVERLADAGIVDALPERDSSLPIDRYELARRIGDARLIVEAIRNLDFDDRILSTHSVTGAKVRVIGAELHLERARALVRALTAGEGYAGEVGGLDYASGDGVSGGLQRQATAAFADAMRLLEERFDKLSFRAAQLWSFDYAASTSFVDGDLLIEIGTEAEAIASEAAAIAQSIAPLEPAHIVDQIVDGRESPPAISADDAFRAWLRWRGHSPSQNPGEDGRAGAKSHSLQADREDATGPGERERAAKELARSFEALVIEFARELAVIRPESDGYGWAVFPGNRLEGGRREGRGGFALSGPVPASEVLGSVEGHAAKPTGIAALIDRVAAGVTAKTGSFSDDKGMEYGWSAATGLGSRVNASALPGEIQTTRIGAEYPVTVRGVEIKAGVGWETVPSGGASESEATLEASVPMFGRRGGIGAAYTVVDLDRLRELTSGERARAEAPLAEREGQVRSWSIGGTVPLSDVGSIKVGYEVRSGTASPVRGHDELLGAGLEYYLGSQGKVRAEYQWGTVEERRGSSTGLGIGYRIGENTSLSASYSMIRFDGEDDEYRDNLGAAKLEVRF